MNILASIFDMAHAFWRRPAVSRGVSLALIISFVLSLLGALLNSRGLLPPPLDGLVPVNPFKSVMLAFALVLGLEIIELIIAISESVSLAVAKQLEIMGLLLLRETFTDISLLGAHIQVEHDWGMLLQIAGTALAGLLLFIMRGLFVRFRFVQDNRDIKSYINAKKCVALALFMILFAAGGYDLYVMFALGEESGFFINFYTSLIFADILLVLGGQYYTPCFHAIFRNSGYAVGTLIMRSSFGAPHYMGALLCVFAGLYILALTWAASYFTPEDLKRKEARPPAAKT